MKSWEWFALGLIPFAGMPVHFLRYSKEGHVPTAAQFTAGIIGSQATAYALQRMGAGKVSEALLLYRAGTLGFVEEGAGRTGYSLSTGKKISGVRNIKGSGVGWRPTFAMRMATPLLVASLIGTGVNILRTDYPQHGDRYRANRMSYQPDFDSYV